MRLASQLGARRLAALLGILLPALAGAGVLQYTQLDYSPTPDPVNTYAFGINNAGQIVGYYWDQTLTGGDDVGFLYHSGTWTSLDRGGQVATDLYGINASGSIAGSDEADDSFLTFYGLRTNSNTTLISDNAVCPQANQGCGNYSEFYGINNDGLIVGTATLGSPNLQGLIYQPGGGYRTFMVNGADTFAHGVNDSGVVVGFYLDTSYHGFVDTTNGSSDSISVVNYPGAVATFIYGINDAGVMVGTYKDALGVYHGFIYSNGSFASYDYASSNNGPAAVDTYFAGINDSGQIVGWFFGSDGVNHAFVTGSATPEPSGWLCVFGGCAVLLWLRRRTAAAEYFNSKRAGRTTR